MKFRFLTQPPQLKGIFTASIFDVWTFFSNSRHQRFFSTYYRWTGVAMTLLMSFPTIVSAAPLRVGVAGSAPFVIREDSKIYGFILPINSPLEQNLNVELRRMSEDGTVKKTGDRWLRSAANITQKSK